MPPMKQAAPMKVPRMTGSSSLMRCLMQHSSRPPKVEQAVASSSGRKMSEGLAAPNWARYIMMEIGMMVMPDVLSTRNMIIASVAVSFSLLSSCSSFIALRPIGVAALSSPSILAETFMRMLP